MPNASTILDHPLVSSRYFFPQRKYFDHAQKLRDFQGRTLVMHARFDELIAAHHAEMLYTVAQEPKQLKIFDQGGHNDIFFRNRAEYMQLVEAFLEAP